MEDSHTFVETKTDSLKVGDEVKWMVTKSTRSGYSFSTKYGKIKLLDSVYAYVQPRNSNRVCEVARSRLVPITQPSPVTEVFKAITSKPEATP